MKVNLKMATKKEEFKARVYDEAVRAVDRGWNIIPLSIKSKKPLCEWKEYQTRKVTHEEVDKWFTEGAPTSGGGKAEVFNLALVTGSISGVIVLDCDNDEAVAYAKKHRLVSPIAVKTTRGYHYYWAHPQHGKRFQNKVGGTSREWVNVKGLDLRGDGGYVVMPPSIKVNEENIPTHQYEWNIADGHDYEDIDDFVWQGSPSDVEEPEVFSFDTLDLSAVKVASIADSMSVWEQTENRVKHLGRLLSEGDGTDDWMVRYCGQMVRRGLTGEDLWQSIINYNEKFFDNSKFTSKETDNWIKTKIQSALEMDRRNHPEDYDSNGQRVEEKKEVEIPRSRLQPIYIDAVDRMLKDMVDEPYWSNPLIPEATITQVVGFNGHGKSYFLSAMLTALSSGNENFGPYEMGRPAKVFYMDYDNPRRTALRRMQEFNKTFGKTNGHFALWSPTLISPEDGGEMNLMEEKDFRLLGEWLKVVSPDILVIDTIRNAFRGLEEASPKDWGIVNLVAKNIRNAGVSVVLVHHRNKPGESGLGREAGSTAQLTDVDTQVFITQVFKDKAEAKAKAGLLDNDLTIFTLDGREFSPYGYLQAQMNADSRLSMVTQISFGKVRQQTELHQTHYIGWCEDLRTGEKYIVSTKSKKQQALKLILKEKKTPTEASRIIKVPVYEIRSWLGLDET